MLSLDKTRELIGACLKKKDFWSLSNDILYEMCKKYPSNAIKEQVIAKTLIIGRVYAVSLERGKGNINIRGDKFYSDKVFPSVKRFFKNNSTSLRSAVKKNVINEGVSLHEKFVKNLRNLRRSNKISFASKYLHFHYPAIFYIYDSRAKKAISILNRHFNGDKKLTEADKIKNTNLSSHEYLNFVSKCEILRNKLEKKYNRKISLRKFDTILISIADSITK
jgi:hypothetical protein